MSTFRPDRDQSTALKRHDDQIKALHNGKQAAPIVLKPGQAITIVDGTGALIGTIGWEGSTPVFDSATAAIHCGTIQTGAGQKLQLSVGSDGSGPYLSITTSS